MQHNDGWNAPTVPVRGIAASGQFIFEGKFSPVELEGKPVPDRQWLTSWAPMANSTLLTGNGGDGKSTIGLQACVATALGAEFLGEPMQKGPAMAICCEDDKDEIHRRLSEICHHYGAALSDLDLMTIWARVGMDNSLMDADFQPGWRRPAQDLPEARFHAIMNAAADMGARLVVLDSLHDLYAANENDRAAVRAFMGKMQVLAKDSGACVLLLSHPSQSGMREGDGTSGSTGWHNAARARVYLRRPKGSEDGANDPSARILEVKKSNYGTTGQIIPIRWQAGAFLAAGTGSRRGDVVDRIQAEQVILRGIDALHALKIVPKLEGRNACMVAKLKRLGLCHGLSRNELEQALNALIGAGRVEVGDLWRGNSRHMLTGLRRAAGAAA